MVSSTASAWGEKWHRGILRALGAVIVGLFLAWAFMDHEAFKDAIVDVLIFTVAAVAIVEAVWWLYHFVPKYRVLREARRINEEGQEFILEGLRLRRALLVALARKDEAATNDLQPRLNAWDAWLNYLKDKQSLEVGWHVPMADVHFEHQWANSRWVSWLDHGSTRVSLALEVVSDVARGKHSRVTAYALDSYHTYFKRQYSLPSGFKPPPPATGTEGLIRP